MDEKTFIQKLAVDSQQDGKGDLSCGDAFRCHRGRLENLLRQGLSIQWEHKLTEVQFASGSQGHGSLCSASFENGSKVDTSCIVSCEGVHSIARQNLSSTSKPQILPYATFNGSRRLSLDEYNQTIRPHINDKAKLVRHNGDAYLEIAINDVTSSRVTISYTYSRPAKEAADPLYRPERPISGATDMPEEFFTEIDGLNGLESPFKEIFDAQRIREDRLLNWLMRCVALDESELIRLSQNGVVLIGDAAHAVPILGGQGAQVAIKDGIDLADFIADNGVEDLAAFARSRIGLWSSAVDDSKKAIAELHTAMS